MITIYFDKFKIKISFNYLNISKNNQNKQNQIYVPFSLTLSYRIYAKTRIGADQDRGIDETASDTKLVDPRRSIKKIHKKDG